MFLERCILKICIKFTGEHPCRSVNCNFICNFIDLLCNFIEITLRHGCYPVNLPHIFRTPFAKNTLDSCFCAVLLMSTLFCKALIKVTLCWGHDETTLNLYQRFAMLKIQCRILLHLQRRISVIHNVGSRWSTTLKQNWFEVEINVAWEKRILVLPGNIAFPYPLKMSESLWFSDVFRG